MPGWLRAPYGREQRDVADVYLALAADLRSGGEEFAGRQQALTAALNTAYDTLLRGRSTASGRSRKTMRLVAVLNASDLMAEAATALGVIAAALAAGRRPGVTAARAAGRRAGGI